MSNMLGKWGDTPLRLGLLYQIGDKFHPTKKSFFPKDVNPLVTKLGNTFTECNGEVLTLDAKDSV